MSITASTISGKLTTGGSFTIVTPTAVINGQVTVATAGNRVPLVNSSTPVSGVIIQALSTNAASVWVGNSSVSSSNGFELQAGQATSVAITDLALVYVDASTNGDKVCFIGS